MKQSTGSKSVAKDREFKLQLLRQLMVGTITLNDFRPRATINLIDFGKLTRVVFNGVNLTNTYITQQVGKLRPGAVIQDISHSTTEASIFLCNENPLPFRSIIINLEPDFTPFNILSNEERTKN